MTSSTEIEELFAQTLSGGYEDDASWDAVRKLRHLGTREVLEKASEWCAAEDPLVRARGADVLAQLGQTTEHPTNGSPDESYAAVSRLLSGEKDVRAARSAIAALGHISDARAIPLIADYRSHVSEEIRFSVACALGNFANDTLAIESLLGLMDDPDEDVRDWATFGLGVLGDADNDEIRSALLRRLDDPYEDACEEAVAGLCKRKDLRVIPVLVSMLEQPQISLAVREAACAMLGMDKDREDWSGRDYIAALRESSYKVM